MSHRARQTILSLTGLLALLTLASGCIYFNTFYLARRHFADAEYARRRAEAADQAVPQAALQSYQQSLRFATRVLVDHPESKWVEEALLLSQKVLYYQGALAASVRKAEELAEAFPGSSFLPESRLFRARGLAELGVPRLAAGEAARAAEELSGELRAEALLVQSLALASDGQLQAATGILDTLIAGDDTPSEIILRARLDLVEYLEQTGSYDQASEILQTVLADPSLPMSERERAIPLLIEMLLTAGETEAAEVWIAELETLNADEFYNGLLRYFRARVFELSGYQERARNEMVVALVNGVTAAWEVRIRLALARIFEEQGFHLVAAHEYRAITEGLGTEEQRTFAARRYEAITGLYTLRSLTARAEDLAFSDPRGIRRQSGQTRTAPRDEVPPPRTEVNRTGEEIEAVIEVEEQETPADEELGNDPEGIYLLLLAEHFALEMDMPDSAASKIALLRALHPGSPLIPRALYAMYDWFRDSGNDLAASAAEELRQEYPADRWTYQLLLDIGEDPAPPDEIVAEEAWLRAEQLADPLADPATWSTAVDSLQVIADRWPATGAARQAALQAARLLELGAGPLDSARAAYEEITERWPETPEAALSRQVLGLAEDTAPTDPLDIRTTRIASESTAWTQWFATQQPARVTRLNARQRGARRTVTQEQVRTGRAEIPPERP